jgi:hypothetical protein
LLCVSHMLNASHAYIEQMITRAFYETSSGTSISSSTKRTKQLVSGNFSWSYINNIYKCHVQMHACHRSCIEHWLFLCTKHQHAQL